MSKLTAQILRDAADSLSEHAVLSTDGQHNYMCLAVQAAAGEKPPKGYDECKGPVRREFEALLTEHGVSLMGHLDWPDDDFHHYYQRAQFVRFDFLNLLAESMDHDPQA